MESLKYAGINKTHILAKRWEIGNDERIKIKTNIQKLSTQTFVRKYIPRRVGNAALTTPSEKFKYL